MTVTYLDSSALLRLCLKEGDTSAVMAALATTPVVSSLASVEVPTAISARFHRGGITSGQCDDLLTLADEILQRVNILQLTQGMLDEAVGVGFRFHVRALDAIHLGTAVATARQQARWGNSLRFCTADVRQSDAAQALLGAPSVELIAPL